MVRSKKGDEVKIVVLGFDQVGKTCFIDMFLEGSHFIRYDAMSPFTPHRTISVSDEKWSLAFMDLFIHGSIAPSWRRMLDSEIAKADGIVLMYDVTNDASFHYVINEPYWHTWHCRSGSYYGTGKPGKKGRRFGCVLVGNKLDLVKEDQQKRAVDRAMAEQWAQSQSCKHFEVSSNDRSETEGVVRALVESIKRARRLDAKDDHSAVASLKDTIGRMIGKSKQSA